MVIAKLQPDGSPLRLGLMAPLSGLVALYGNEISIAAKIACEEVNENGGVLGRPIELIIRDDGSLPESAVPAAIKLVRQDKCMAIIGNLMSNARIAVAGKVVESLKVPYLNFSFYEGSIFNRYFFHFAALPNQQIDRMIPFVVRKFGPKIFFAGSNYEWPKGSIDAGIQSLRKEGGEVVGEEYLPLGSGDIELLLKNVASSGADVFIPYFAGEEQLHLITRFSELGLKKKMAVIMGHYDEEMVSRMCPEVRAGCYSCNTYFMTIGTSENNKLLQKLAGREGITGIWPAGNGILTNFGEGTYLCVKAWAQAVNKAGSIELDPVIAALENVIIQGPQGEVRMDMLTHHASVNVFLSVCEPDGSFRIIEKLGLIDPQIPERYKGEFEIQPQVMETDFSAARQINEEFSTKTGIARITRDGIYIYANTKFCELLKIDVDHLDREKSFILFLLEMGMEDASLAFVRIYLQESDVEKIYFHDRKSNDSKEIIQVEIIGIPDEEGIYSSFLLKASKFSERSLEYTRSALPANLAYCLVDESGNIVMVNSEFYHLLGYENEKSLLFSKIECLFNNQATYNEIFHYLQGNDLWEGGAKLTGKNGRIVEKNLLIEKMKNTINGMDQFSIMIQDNKTILNDPSGEILNVADVAIIATDENAIIVEANEFSSKIFGYSREELLSSSVHRLLPPKYRERHKESFKQFIHSPEKEIPMGIRGEIFGYRKDGSEFPAQASIAKVKMKDGWLLVATIRDITERKEADKKLLWQANHDPLTRLPNRNLLKERLGHALERSAKTGLQVGLLFLDLDNFKLINDTYGHNTGDALLLILAEKIVSSVRPGDAVARFGGDEFVVVCEQITDRETMVMVADRIIEKLKQPVVIDGHNLYSSVSIGIAIGNAPETDVDVILKNADAAMYSAKAEGRDRYRLFDPEIHKKVENHLIIANGLRTAIEKTEFKIMLQPIVDAFTGRIVGCESLLRWQTEWGFVSPDLFIPIAESTGMIHTIGQWVFRASATVQQIIKTQIMDPTHRPYVSVNISTHQLANKFIVEQLNQIIYETGADPEGILLEITESALMEDMNSNAAKISKLGELGFKIAVDDFGTGYSSFSHLVQMPLNSLKIDKVFVDNLDRHSGADTVASAIIQMAKALNLKVIAEGVETERQLEFLRFHKCDSIQGFYFYKPLEISSFLQLLDYSSSSS